MSDAAGLSRRHLLGVLCASGTVGCTRLERTVFPCGASWKDDGAFHTNEAVTGRSIGSEICGPDDDHRCLHAGVTLVPGAATRLEARWPDGTVAATAPVEEADSVDEAESAEVTITGMDTGEVYEVRFVLLDGTGVVESAIGVYDCR